MGAREDGRLRLLVLDAYPPEGRESLRRHGAREAGALYDAMLRRLAPGAEVHVAFPADPEPGLPGGAELGDFDGAAWTGSSLTIHREDDPRVGRQVGLARALLEAGVPCFGSCWAAQLAAVVAGGACAANPRGREFGLARKITLTEAGRGHPLLAARGGAFDAFTSHADEVVKLPAGALRLAGNAFTRVQALAVEHAGTPFWALQYHPEYDLHEVARLACVRAEELVDRGTFADRAALDAWVAAAEALHSDPLRRDLAWQLGVDEDVLDPAARTAEVRVWLDTWVRPRRARR